jgi:hypothetical protein
MDKAAYIEFCRQAPPDFPVFMQHWYLDAVCAGGQWDAVVVYKREQIAGVLPFFYKKIGPFKYVTMPLLGRFMGPYLRPEWRAPMKATSLLKNLVDALPRFIAYSQDFNYSADNWLPFYWKKYRQTTRYSYVLDLSQSLETLRNNLAPDYRNQKIPKAQAAVEIREEALSAADFLRIHDLSYTRQGLKAPVTISFLKKLDAALVANQQRSILTARERETGEIVGVAYLIWDQQRAYYLMAGEDPAQRNSGAGILLAWEAIVYAKNILQVPIFDFAGSMQPGIERVRRQFGAKQEMYLRVFKRNVFER